MPLCRLSTSVWDNKIDRSNASIGDPVFGTGQLVVVPFVYGLGLLLGRRILLLAQIGKGFYHLARG